MKVIPRTAFWLGIWGLLPFVALALTINFGSQSQLVSATSALVAYGAVILSFIGGIDWGRSLCGDSKIPKIEQSTMMIISNIPPLLGWASLLIGVDWGLFLLILGFVIKLLIDFKLTRQKIYNC